LKCFERHRARIPPCFSLLFGSKLIAAARNIFLQFSSPISLRLHTASIGGNEWKLVFREIFLAFVGDEKVEKKNGFPSADSQRQTQSHFKTLKSFVTEVKKNLFRPRLVSKKIFHGQRDTN
jgi:hypothetical protein